MSGRQALRVPGSIAAVVILGGIFGVQICTGESENSPQPEALAEPQERIPEPARVAPPPEPPEPQPEPPAYVPVVDVLRIAGHDKTAVAAELGTGACADSRAGERCTYRDGTVEIVFVGGVADWISIYDLGDQPFARGALRAIGLPVRAPSFENENVLRWSGIEGLREVSIFPKPGGVDYAYVLARTQP